MNKQLENAKKCRRKEEKKRKVQKNERNDLQRHSVDRANYINKRIEEAIWIQNNYQRTEEIRTLK